MAYLSRIVQICLDENIGRGRYCKYECIKSFIMELGIKNNARPNLNEYFF